MTAPLAVHVDTIVSDIPVTFAGPAGDNEATWGGAPGDVVCRIFSGCAGTRAEFLLNDTTLTVRYSGNVPLDQLWTDLANRSYDAGSAINDCWYTNVIDTSVSLDYNSLTGDYDRFCCQRAVADDDCGYYYNYYSYNRYWTDHQLPATLVVGLMVVACIVLCAICLAVRCLMQSSVRTGMATSVGLVQAEETQADDDVADVAEEVQPARTRRGGKHGAVAASGGASQGGSRRGSSRSMRAGTMVAVSLCVAAAAWTTGGPAGCSLPSVAGQVASRPCMPVAQCVVRTKSLCDLTQAGSQYDRDDVLTWQSSIRTVASPRITLPYILRNPTFVDMSSQTATSTRDALINSTNLLAFYDDFTYTCPNQAYFDFCAGRPLQDHVVATCEATAEPNVSPRAREWLQRGLAEHASVASFGVESVSLSRFGAPLDLLRRVNEAALDEVRHADLCFALAVKFGANRTLAVPGSMDDLGSTVRIAGSLVELVRDTVRAGCIAEADAAARAVETVRRLEAEDRADATAVDADVLAAWRIIASDESRHAQLAWDTVKWAVSQCGDECKRVADDELRAAGKQWPADQ